jgi:hypothetical protein
MTMLHAGLRCFVYALPLGAIAVVASCSSDGNEEGTNGGASAAGGSISLDGSSAGGAGGTGGASAGLLEGVDGRGGSASDAGVDPVLPGDECAGAVFEGEALPLDLLIMMDRSISMGDSQPEYTLPGGGTKWDAVRLGFENFFGLPEVQSLNAGIDFFGQDDCDPQTYSTPEVAIAPITQTAPAILSSYEAQAPGGNTPIGPALEGALIHAYDWKVAHPAAEVAVVLVTDGVPNGCGPTTSDPRGGADSIAPIAASYANGSPPVRTFVLGIQGMEVPVNDFRYVAETIAQAGDTTEVVVEATDDLAAKFSSALDGIRAAAAPPCSYGVPLPPNNEQLDLGRVNVVLLPEGSGPEPIFNVSGPDQCQNGGWYYDPPQDPQTIQLCPSTCDVVSKLTGAGFQVLFGCATVSIPR